MKQKSRIFFITSWLVLRLRWSLALMLMSVSSLTLQRLKAEPGIVLLARHRRDFPADRWVFEKNSSAYLYALPNDETLRVYILPEISPN